MSILCYIRIGGYLGAQGNGQLLITLPPPYTVSTLLSSVVSGFVPVFFCK